MSSSKGSILLVGNFLSSSGGSRGVCEELALRLSASGWRVLTTSHHPQRALRLFDIVRTAYLKKKEYAVAQVDVYSGQAFLWAEAVCGVLKRMGKPYVLTLHGGNLPGFARRHPKRVRRLLCAAQIVTVPSRYLFEQMKPYRNDILLLPNPIDLSAYAYRCRENPAPRLTWLRAFHSIYNPMLGPQVLVRLKPEFPEAHLTMVGPDKGDGSLQQTQQTAEKLKVADSLHLPGGVPKAEVPAWLNQGDIFLNTTNVDNTPISVLEAMACGLCVVSTNVGGLPYLLNHETDALLVPPEKEEAMASAVRRILTEPDLARRLSQNGRAKAEQHDWQTILPQWEQLLSSLVQNAPSH